MKLKFFRTNNTTQRLKWIRVVLFLYKLVYNNEQDHLNFDTY